MIRLTVAGTEVLHRPGPGATLVLLHGIGSDALSWAPMIEALPSAFDVVAWWAPGYGESTPVEPERPAPADYAARVLSVLDAMHRDRVVLVGHSLGTLFAASFAARHPERVAALALFSPALGYGVRRGEALPPRVQARIDDLAALGPEEFSRARATRLAHRPEALPGVQRAMSQLRLPGYAQAVHALAQGDLLTDAARITVPTLIACGAQDVVTPPDYAQRVHRAIQGSRLRMVAECGHVLPQETPDEAAALVAELADD
jgi:pimeloyl-ACP methyl ester carboxylesterase